MSHGISGRHSVGMAEAKRRLHVKFASMVEQKVRVRLVNGNEYVGKLVGLSLEEGFPHLIVEGARSGDKAFPLVFVNGRYVTEVVLEEIPLFDPDEFAELVIQRMRLPPTQVRVLADIGKVAIAGGRIIVGEDGVEGSGMLANQVHSLWVEYMNKKKELLGTK